MASTPAWASLPLIGMVQISTANTNRDGTTGTYGTLLTGASSGSPIARIRIVAPGTTTAGMIRFFLNDGTNKRLIFERRVTPITPSGTIKCFEDEFEISDFGVKDASWSIICSTHNAEVFNVFAYAGSL
jgi:hypothetical protein